MNVLLQLCAGNLATQIKNLNNAIEANWKEAVGYPGSIKLVFESKWLVLLGCILAVSFCRISNIWNKSNMIGSVGLLKYIKPN